MGHVRNYTIGDVSPATSACWAKTFFSQSAGTLWSACGRRGGEKQHRASTVDYDNIAYMKNQLKMLGFGYD